MIRPIIDKKTRIEMYTLSENNGSKWQTLTLWDEVKSHAVLRWAAVVQTLTRTGVFNPSRPRVVR